jgi:hypothetical protein
VGDSSDKNDKTQMLSDSQVIEVKPSTPKLPARASKPAVDDKNDRSVWKGLVVGADDFAPPPPAKSSGGRWIVLGILAAAAIGAGAYVVWPKARAPVAAPVVAIDAAATPAVAPPGDALPQDAAAVDATLMEDAAAADAAVPEDAASRPDAGVRPIRRKPPPKRLLKHKH